MRLLDAQTCELKEFFSPLIPPYAILSHTWDEEEIILQDLARPETITDKKGFQKIKKCCAQALIDGHDWVWVDTCCIDKTSSAELSEAINSMYRWYQEAEVCYAYIRDLPPQISENLDQEAFKSAKWFTRGWTLQELIAPKIVEFYDEGWNRVGTKSQLRNLIKEITGVKSRVLLGTKSPWSVSVAERLSWAATRSTSREEDIAYCLLGILNINMPLLYGEGPRAFIRLQEEFLRTSEDLTLLLWTLEPNTTSDSDLEESGILASSPDGFAKIKIIDSEGHHFAILNNCWDVVKLPQHYLSPLRHLRGPTWRAEEGHVPVPPAITPRGLHVELVIIMLPGKEERYFAWTGRLFSQTGNPSIANPRVGYLCIELCRNGQAFRVNTGSLLFIDSNQYVTYARLLPLYLATKSSSENRYDNDVSSAASIVTDRSADGENSRFKLLRSSRTWAF
ncbi:HET domain-containing protein [Colletotrichum karsti]|uniref:HET domain-containing protein n=1 Tax=Colletotrichum karsti TaxID=1095194 RepID=A0A9P6LL66_9PEZI|nr:HET domain-containing protein [Colletotrichum karsti]KAF9876916.1 HET domain-containing protein [Colletotrichum karsti]